MKRTPAEQLQAFVMAETSVTGADFIAIDLNCATLPSSAPVAVIERETERLRK